MQCLHLGHLVVYRHRLGADLACANKIARCFKRQRVDKDVCGYLVGTRIGLSSKLQSEIRLILIDEQSGQNAHGRRFIHRVRCDPE